MNLRPVLVEDATSLLTRFSPQQDSAHGSSESEVTLQCTGAESLSPVALESFREGLERLESGRALNAVASLSRCVHLAPEFTAGRVCLGVAYALSSNIYPAIDQLELATRIDPASFAAHFKLAQLYFKLRIPVKGYAAATQALRCAHSRDERRILAQLLQKEREREHNGIARPWFFRKFSWGTLAAAGGVVAALAAFAAFVR